MKYRKMTKSITAFLITAGFFALMSCSQNPVGGNEAQELQGTLKRGIPTEEMNFISWKPEILEKLNTRALTGEHTRTINDGNGGKVGGPNTLDNKVAVPGDALNSNKVTMTVRVLNIEDGVQNGAGVDFLPSQHFEKAVKITLSWAFLETSEDVDFTPYYSDDDGASWFTVGDENYEIDYDKKTISFYVDHFTRFSWGTM